MRIVSLVMLGLFLIQACSAFNPSTQLVTVNCSPKDTRVMLNGERFDCPAKAYVRRDKKLLVEAYREGYAPYRETIDYHLNKSGENDIAGSIFIIIPIFGLLLPGAWDLDQTEIEIQLEPQK
ncbi:MAG: hypothetical protein ABFD62_02845 [Syntrophaceae bacterium]